MLSLFVLDLVCGSYLAFRKPPIRYTDLQIPSQLSLLYEISCGTSFAKVNRLGANNGCCRQTDAKKFLCIGAFIGVKSLHCVVLYLVAKCTTLAWQLIYDLAISMCTGLFKSLFFLCFCLIKMPKDIPHLFSFKNTFICKFSYICTNVYYDIYMCVCVFMFPHTIYYVYIFEIEGGRFMIRSDGKLCFSETDRGYVWKDCMERIIMWMEMRQKVQ